MKAYRIAWWIFAGLVGALGVVMAATWPLAGIVVLTVPAYCLRKLREHGHLSGRESSRPEEPGPKSPPRIALELLDDRALCLAWRVSFSGLQRAGTAEQRLRIVDERRAYLDELERRTASGLAAWLASGPRAAGDPSRFVLGNGAAGGASIDWDTLLHDTDT
jgi:hypothetical protein